MQNLYDVLGVPRDANDAEIKKAYRALAKKLHPDTSKGDAKVAEKFKQISAAYTILGDKEKRPKYDRGEIDAEGNDVHPGFARTASGQGGFEQFQFGGLRAEDLFKDLFGGMAGATGPRPPQSRRKRGKDRPYKLSISFLDAARGTTKRITLADGKALDVKISAGVEEGQQIRLKGQGDPGVSAGPSGDALVEIRVQPHKYFSRDRGNVYLDVPITISEAVLGARITVPTIDGEVAVTIPPAANTGQTLRLKGRGISSSRGKKARGDQFIRLQVMLPDRTDEAFSEFVRKWPESKNYDVRAKFQLE